MEKVLPRKRSYDAPYKSKLEQRIHEGPMQGYLYEPKDSIMEYSIHKKYTPDLVHPDDPAIVYEIKGRFRTYDEAMKYVWIKKSNPDITIRFIITNPNIKAYPQKKITLGNWLDKQGFEWATEDNIPDEWKRK